MRAAARATTPYGTVMQHMPFVLGGKPYQWPYLHPFALLHYLCSLSVAYASIVCSSLRGLVANIILYADECTPGNVLRHDSGRQVWCIYWTFKELPEFLRHREVGWLSFGYIRTTLVSQIKGQLGICLTQVGHGDSSPWLGQTQFQKVGGFAPVPHVRRNASLRQTWVEACPRRH